LLEYEMARHGMNGISTVVEYIMRIIDASRRASGTASQRGGEVFWEDSSRVVQRYTLPPLYAANGSLTFPDIIRFVSTAPASAQQAASAEWQQNSFMFRMLKLAAERPKVRMADAALRNIATFWREQWPSIPDKTREAAPCALLPLKRSPRAPIPSVPWLWSFLRPSRSA
jgi:hypothetical protein